MSFEQLPKSKPTSKGPEWVERKEAHRGRDPHSIFGYNILVMDAMEKKRGAFYKEISADPAVMALPEVLRASETRRLKRALIALAREQPSIMKKIISNSTLWPEDSKRWLKALALSNDSSDISDTKVVLDEILRRPERVDDIDIKLWLPFLQEHAMHVLDKQKEFDRYFDDFKQRFSTRLQAKIQHGELPLNPQLAEERLNTLRMVVMDSWNAKLEEAWGDYDSQSHEARINYEIPDQEWESTMTHETFHALSGQSETIDLTGDNVTRSGLGISKYGAFRTRWLNEAVTEDLTMHFLGKKKSLIYPVERKLMAKLIEAGVSKQTLHEAYFENYEVKEPGEHRMPKMRQLFVEADAATGYVGFITDVSAYIETFGEQEALKVWQKKKENFLPFLKQWAEERRRRAQAKPRVDREDPRYDRIMEITHKAGGHDLFWRDFLSALPAQGRKVLQNAGIDNVYSLLAYSRKELEELPGCGGMTAVQIALAVQSRGLRMRQNS